MFADYVLFVVIALVTGVIILLRLLSSEHKYLEKRFIQLILLTIGHNLIDIFWGLTYFDKIGMGSVGLRISTSLYFCSNAVLVFAWFLFLHKLLHRNETKLLTAVLAGLPMALIILLVFVNIRTGVLFTVGETVDTYTRGKWFPVERIGTSGYLFVVFAWSFLKFVQAGEKREKRRYAVITAFAMVPFVLDLLQVFFITIPCTSIAFQITIIIVYSFISVEKEKNLLFDTLNHTRDITEKRQKKEIEKQLEEIKQLNAEMGDRIALIQSMSKVYFASFFVDVTKGTFEEISNIEPVRSKIGTTGTVQVALDQLCDQMVSPETADNLREFVNLSTIDERMKDTDVITCEYVGVTSGWSRLYLIAGDRDENGSIKTLFVASRSIHVEKQREEKQNQIIEEARIAAEKANNAKTTFLFNMSHDIRTPMNAIVGYSELMKQEIHNPEKLMEYQKKIQMSSEFLLSLLNDVLDMARIESGKEQLNETFQNKTGSIVGEVIRVFEMQAQEKNITLSSDVDVTHEYILCDIVKVRKIFTNLISNAIKYTPAGGRIHVSTTELPSERVGYVLYRTVIEDNGIGMSKEFLPHIFDSFSRERNTTQGKVAGTGLGMAIVKALVDLMDGTIEVESELGIGTKITLTISHQIAQSAYYEETQKKQNVDKSIFRGKRVLLAEDNKLNAEIAMVILKGAGFLVEHAEDGVICVDMLQKSEEGYYDLILMDIQMPNMDGYMATRTIRNMSDPYRKKIPIIAVTANAFDSDKKMAMEAGMNGHLAKPIQVDELFRTLAENLK